MMHSYSRSEKESATYEFCKSLLENDLSNDGLRMANRRLNQRSFRRRPANNIRRSQCRIEFYEGSHFQGEAIALAASAPVAMLGERSIRTVGRCCWRLFTWENIDILQVILVNKLFMFTISACPIIKACAEPCKTVRSTQWPMNGGSGQRWLSLSDECDVHHFCKQTMNFNKNKSFSGQKSVKNGSALFPLTFVSASVWNSFLQLCSMKISLAYEER